MGIKQTLDVINAMEAEGVIRRYAISGAIAAYNYIEAAVTDDLDILLAFENVDEDQQSGLITLAPIYSYLKSRGYGEHRREGIVIEGWPVQFLPVANRLDEDALAKAQEIDIELSGDFKALCEVLRTHELLESWRQLCARIGMVDPCGVEGAP